MRNVWSPTMWERLSADSLNLSVKEVGGGNLTMGYQMACDHPTPSPPQTSLSLLPSLFSSILFMQIDQNSRIYADLLTRIISPKFVAEMEKYFD
jgi:hypothetical protein